MGGAGNALNALKVKLDCELNTARAAATDEWISDTNVAGRGNHTRARSGGVADFASVHNLSAVDEGICDKCRQKRIGKIWMIGKVEEVGAELKTKLFL